MGVKNKALKAMAILAFVICVLSAKPIKAEQTFLADWIQTVYSEEDVPVSKANHILQTRDGYIWIGSYEGLVRFDGRKSKLFREVEDGFPSCQINTLYEAKNGDLWIGTNDEGLFLYKDGAFQRFGTSQGMPSESVWDIDEDSVGNLYVATNYGMALVTPEYRLHLITNQRQNPLFATHIAITRKDELWCVASDGSVYVMNMEKTMRSYEPRHFDGRQVISVICSSNNDVYLGTEQNKVIRVRGEGYVTLDVGAKTGINHLYEDGVGRVWVLSDTGMGYLKDEKFHSVDGSRVESGLESMVEDYEGNYWFASSTKGVLHLIRSKFRDMNFALSLPERTVNATCRFGGNLYIGAEEGLIILNEKGERVENPLSQSLRGVRVKDMAADKNGSLWICTYSDYGLVRCQKNGNFTRLTERDGLPSNRLKKVMVTSDGLVITYAVGGVSVIKDGQVVKNHMQEDGFSHTEVTSFSEDGNGVVHMGTNGGGVVLLDPGKGELSRLTKKEGLQTDVVMRLRYDKYKDGIWIACSNGLSFLDQDGVHPVDKLEGYDSGILDIKIINNDTIWLITMGEAFIVSKYNLFSEEPLQITRMDVNDGLRSAVTPSARNLLDKDGTLHLACAKGVWTISTSDVYRNDTVPKIAINHVRVDGKEYADFKDLRIPAGAKRITIDYALLTYSSMSGSRVHYRLEGFDEDKATDELDMGTSVSYTNLKGGRYRFIIQGTNKEGVPSETLELEWRKERGLFETAGAKLAFALLLALACVCGGALFARGRVRALRIKNKEYGEVARQGFVAISALIDERLGNAKGHSERVAAYGVAVAKRLGISKKDRERLQYAALLHDADKLNEDKGFLEAVHGFLDSAGKDPYLQSLMEMVDFYENVSTAFEGDAQGDEWLEELRKVAGTRFDYEMVEAMLEVVSESLLFTPQPDAR